MRVAAVPGTALALLAGAAEPDATVAVDLQRVTSQRIDVRGGATRGVTQRLALPDYRVSRYKLHFWTRAEAGST